MHRKHPMWLAALIGTTALVALAVAILSFPRDAKFPTNDKSDNSMTKTFQELIALKNDNGEFTISSIINAEDASASPYEESGSRATKTPVVIAVDKQSFLVNTNEFRLYVSPEKDSAIFRLNANKEYFGRIAEEDIPMPPGAENRSRFVLMISDKPFAENGDPTVDPTPRTRTIR